MLAVRPARLRRAPPAIAPTFIMPRVEWLDPIPNVRFAGGPVECTITGTCRFMGRYQLYVRIPMHDHLGYGYLVYVATVDSAFRDVHLMQE